MTTMISKKMDCLTVLGTLILGIIICGLGIDYIDQVKTGFDLSTNQSLVIMIFMAVLIVAALVIGGIAQRRTIVDNR